MPPERKKWTLYATRMMGFYVVWSYCGWVLSKGVIDEYEHDCGIILFGGTLVVTPTPGRPPGRGGAQIPC